MAILFGKEIYERKIPIVMNSEELVDNGRVPISDFPLIFFFYDNDGNNLEDIYSRLLVRTTFFNMDLQRRLDSKEYKGFTKCNPDDFTNHKEFVEKTVTQAQYLKMTPYCTSVGPDFVIQNPAFSPNSTTMRVVIRDCHEELKNLYINAVENQDFELPPCKPLTFTTQLIHVSMTYINSFIDPKNYTNPIVNYQETATFTMENGSAYRYRFELKKTLISTDVGWMLEEKSDQEALTLNKPAKELFIPSLYEKLTIELDVPLKRGKVTRNYLKLQELFAKIGGLFNAVNIICHVLLYDYIRFKYRVYYSRFGLTEEDFNDSQTNKDSKQNMGIKLNKKTSVKIVDEMIERQGSRNKKGSIPQQNSINNKVDETPFQLSHNIQPHIENKEAEKKQKSPPMNPDQNELSNNMLLQPKIKESPSMFPERNLKANKEETYNINIVNNNFSSNSEINVKDEQKYFRTESMSKKNLSEMKKQQKESQNNSPVKSPLNNNFAESPSQSKVLNNNFVVISKALDIVKVNDKIAGSSKVESIKAIDKVNYSTYVLNRACFCCYSQETKNKAVNILISDYTKGRYSFRNYLINNRKFNV
eukprot:CAMPEP_0170527210 /NCGR_PEP_ID=MMETSP0209-20121228/12674_1 /TAXON_ID=665100 ORGANISM="Litonotus pictus, Strain P1" /NCGR_SAMPLE_ID=MMETSP0209 /ASSEMBLY_ACC=CAM_ASM_000301 /LENGTH=587 /DNA_ID=CAMNT_0010817585 /DNA_START=53 /DNA_END=1812 /DNA_ORIENTATION=-